MLVHYDGWSKTINSLGVALLIHGALPQKWSIFN